MYKNRKILKMVNWYVLLISGAALIFFVAFACIAPDAFSRTADTALAFVLKYFTWFITLVAFSAIIFCLWAGFSKYGKIRLGGPEAVPRINKFVWYAIALTSGIAVGINYYGVYEPIQFIYNPPPFLDAAPLSSAAVFGALKYTFLHWCIHPYSIYTAAGLSLVFLIYNSKKDYRVCTALYPLAGDKIYGAAGNAVDALVIFAIIGGIATSLGFATLQIARGFDIIMGFTSNLYSWVVIIAVITLFYTLSSISGLHRGITYISNLNTVLYFFVLVFAFIAVDPVGVTELTITAVGQYFNDFINLSLFLDPIEKTGWIGANNVFFNTWWMVFAPLIGLFLVKLAYGRTIREFVVINLIAPVVFSFAWFGIFGGGSILLEKFYGANISELIEQTGSDMALYAFFKQLPWSTVMNVVALVIVVLSFVTLAESMTMSISAMSMKQFKDVTGEAAPPRSISIFWGSIMAVTAAVLLSVGGTEALQTASIVCGLPIALLMVLMMASYYRAMKHLRQYDDYSRGDLDIYKKDNP